MDPEDDVVVVIAGCAGLYAVHKLRDELVLSVAAFETADGVGGTWWWNRYTAARCDFESEHYSYSFASELAARRRWPNPKQCWSTTKPPCAETDRIYCRSSVTRRWK